MIDSQRPSQRRPMRSFPADRGQLKTSTYIVPCFLFVEFCPVRLVSVDFVLSGLRPSGHRLEIKVAARSFMNVDAAFLALLLSEVPAQTSRVSSPSILSHASFAASSHGFVSS
ncbi:hypothetical protein CRENBAI_002798, partial [Crenichthys baileyi]